MTMTRSLLFDLPDDHDPEDHFKMEDQGILDMVYWGAMEAHLSGDDTLLVETLASYSEMFEDSGLIEYQITERCDLMYDAIQRVVWSLKDYADPIKEYVRSPRVDSFDITDVRVHLDTGCFIVTVEIYDALGD